MSSKQVHFVWSKSPYEHGTLLVHLCLADGADDDGYGQTKNREIAEKSRLKLRAVQMARKKMKDEGFLEEFTEADTEYYRLKWPGRQIKERVISEDVKEIVVTHKEMFGTVVSELGLVTEGNPALAKRIGAFSRDILRRQGKPSDFIAWCEEQKGNEYTRRNLSLNWAVGHFFPWLKARRDKESGNATNWGFGA